MNIILMGTPHHANIGDLAIAYSEEKMIKELFPNKKLYIMQEEKLDVCAKKVKNYIKNDDIILLHGGGNIGDTYVTPEKGRRTVISTFPENKIIILPVLDVSEALVLIRYQRLCPFLITFGRYPHMRIFFHKQLLLWTVFWEQHFLFSRLLQRLSTVKMTKRLAAEIRFFSAIRL